MTDIVSGGLKTSPFDLGRRPGGLTWSQPPQILTVAQFTARYGPHVGGSRRLPGDWDRTAAGLWERAPERMVALERSIASEGIRVPVRVGRLDHGARYVVRDGHHRVAVALDFDVEVPFVVVASSRGAPGDDDSAPVRDRDTPPGRQGGYAVKPAWGLRAIWGSGQHPAAPGLRQMQLGGASGGFL